MAGLIDQFGRAISADEIRRLRQPVAQPSFSAPRSPFANYFPATGLTPESLAAILQQSGIGQSQQYMQLLEDIEERELHYRAVLTTRKNQVSQLPITVKAASDDPAHEQHADFLRAWIATGALRAALFHMMDGLAKGYSVLEIAWRTEPNAVLPLRFVWRHQRYFEVDWRDGETILLRTNNGEGRDPLAPHKFVVHRHVSKSGQVLRGGLGRVAVWAWMYKSFTMQDWAVFVRHFGQPVRLGRYGPDSTEQDRDTLWRAVANIAGDMAAIVPKSMEIEFIEPGNVAQSSELYERRCRWIDEQVSKLVLGQTATTDAIAGGHAVSKEHRQVQEDYERADAALLCGSINAQVVRDIIAFNFGPQPAYPVVEIGRPDEVPIAEMATAVERLGPLGLRVRASEIRDRLGLTPPPGAEDDVIGGRPLPGTSLPTPGLPTLNLRTPPPAPAGLGLRTLHARQAPVALEALLDRVSLDAEGALSGLVDAVKTELMAATDLQDLAQRIARLELDPAELAQVLGRGMALANLAGQQQVLEEMRAAPPAP
jgi:phage gp29-like protein